MKDVDVECRMLNEEIWKQNMDIDLEYRKQDCWNTFQAYHILLKTGSLDNAIDEFSLA